MTLSYRYPRGRQFKVIIDARRRGVMATPDISTSLEKSGTEVAEKVVRAQLEFIAQSRGPLERSNPTWSQQKLNKCIFSYSKTCLEEGISNPSMMSLVHGSNGLARSSSTTTRA